MERMMKVQDVLLKAMAKKITWWAAAEILGVTDRTMRRWREKLEKDGYAGLADRRKGKSPKRIPLATIEQVLKLYKETYYDLNIRHFHEKLWEEHAIRLSKHRWLNDDRWYDLIVILDDATSEICCAQLVEEESTRTVMAGLREVIEKQGLFCTATGGATFS
jgi:transposase